ncbi:MAG TPA: TIGR03619 family F420-dependent LLM class oxidoreductase [Dehalococcoidia bacterium]|nr:TIGR03619 family F420-dependent LLM class oxidoreductase [Dehalococcoidia bacterium]
MRFGFSLFPFTRFAGAAELAAVAKLGDELGFDAVLLPEHLLPPRWPDADLTTKYWFDLPALAAYLAAVTERIRFLTGVIVVPYHQPVALAKALATLDVLSNGRLSCGVGAGWMRAEFRRLGIPFEERGAITDEYLRAMQELWTSEAPAFHGRYVSFEDVSFFPRPVQQPSIPLYIGGTGPRPFRRVAELGDGWLPMTGTPAAVAAGVAQIRRQLLALGRDPAGLWVGCTGLSLGVDAEVQAMRRHVVGGGSTRSREARPLRDRDEIVAAVQEYAAAGVTFLSVGFAWQNARELMHGLERFARDLLPACR